MEALIFPLHSDWLYDHEIEEKTNNLDTDSNRQISFQEYSKKFSLDLSNDNDRLEMHRHYFNALDTNGDTVLVGDEITNLLAPNKTTTFTAQAKELLLKFDKETLKLLWRLKFMSFQSLFAVSRHPIRTLFAYLLKTHRSDMTLGKTEWCLNW